MITAIFLDGFKSAIPKQTILDVWDFWLSGMTRTFIANQLNLSVRKVSAIIMDYDHKIPKHWKCTKERQ